MKGRMDNGKGGRGTAHVSFGFAITLFGFQANSGC